MYLYLYLYVFVFMYISAYKYGTVGQTDGCFYGFYDLYIDMVLLMSNLIEEKS